MTVLETIEQEIAATEAAKGERRQAAWREYVEAMKTGVDADAIRALRAELNIGYGDFTRHVQLFRNLKDAQAGVHPDDAKAALTQSRSDAERALHDFEQNIPARRRELQEAIDDARQAEAGAASADAGLREARKSIAAEFPQLFGAEPPRKPPAGYVQTFPDPTGDEYEKRRRIARGEQSPAPEPVEASEKGRGSHQVFTPSRV